ncbi:MAG: 3-deoxy-manno-octulosonate cytidylyltransferase [Candidatus Cloacimonetes bacterium]|nr:3-deoxy-manno-octulosonate cytidylyltransferase [Candidatus Cloacimonadota bacterium]
MGAIAAIPARMASERLPGKPLQLLAGKPLIQRVYEVVQETGLFHEVLVLTDSNEIKDCVEGFGGFALLTSPDCQSGTERILEIRDKLNQVIIVNVQGDEPFISKEALSNLINVFNNQKVEIASLMHRLDDSTDLKSPNSVKVTVDLNKDALYFSRSLIPYNRNKSSELDCPYYKHIGVYAFRKGILDLLADLGPGILEHIEKLEQLRWLEHGFKIRMVNTDYKGFGIDTKEDLEKAELLFDSIR